MILGSLYCILLRLGLCVEVTFVVAQCAVPKTGGDASDIVALTLQIR